MEPYLSLDKRGNYYSALCVYGHIFSATVIYPVLCDSSPCSFLLLQMATLPDHISENSALPLVSADYAVQMLENFMNNAKYKREHMIKKMKHVYMTVETCYKILSVPDGECDEKTKGALREYV
jgi:hypothetical protein